MASKHEDCALLGIDINASQEEISAAFRRKAKLCHPDRGGNVEEFKKIQSAYERLMQPEQVKIPAQPDIFSAMFQAMGISGKNTGIPIIPIEALKLTYTTSLENFCRQETVNLLYKYTIRQEPSICPNCHGRGLCGQPILFICLLCQGKGIGPLPAVQNENNETITLSLAPEMAQGGNITIENKGHVIGNRRGPVIINIKCLPHSTYSIKPGPYDLTATAKISLSTVLCGGNFIIAHPNGETINVKYSNVTPEIPLVIPNKGLTTNGNLYIDCKIEWPNLNDEQRKKLGEFLTSLYEVENRSEANLNMIEHPRDVGKDLA
jgi:DnaJ-class molecular chaperone